MAISQHPSLHPTRRLFQLLGLLLALLLLGHLFAPRALGFDARNGEQLTIGAGELPDWAGPAAAVSTRARRYAPFLVGLPVFVIATAIPGVGSLIGVLATIMAMGAVWIRVRDRDETAPTAMAIPAPTRIVA